MDLRPQNSRKSPIPTLERLDLSSCYFLKQDNIDISQNVKFLSQCIERSRGDRDRGLKKRLRGRHLANWQCSYREQPNELATTL